MPKVAFGVGLSVLGIVVVSASLGTYFAVKKNQEKKLYAERIGYTSATSNVAGGVRVTLAATPQNACEAMGGTYIDKGDGLVWGNCVLTVCKGNKNAWGFSPAGTTPYYGIIGEMTYADCKKIGGAVNGTPSDTQITSCHSAYTPLKESKSFFASPGKCPTGMTVGKLSDFNKTAVSSEQCVALGGVPDSSGKCNLDICISN